MVDFNQETGTLQREKTETVELKISEKNLLDSLRADKTHKRGLVQMCLMMGLCPDKLKIP